MKAYVCFDRIHLNSILYVQCLTCMCTGAWAAIGSPDKLMTAASARHAIEPPDAFAVFLCFFCLIRDFTRPQQHLLVYLYTGAIFVAVSDREIALCDSAKHMPMHTA